MVDKLFIEEKNFRDGSHQIAYICSRTKGRAEKILDIFTRANGRFYRVDEVFDELKEHLNNFNFDIKMRNKYKRLVQDYTSVENFLLEFLECASYKLIDDSELIYNCIDKLNKRLHFWVQHSLRNIIS